MSRLGTPGAKPKLRKREIAIAIGAGLLAAGGAAAVLESMNEDDRGHEVVVIRDGGDTERTYEVGPFEQIASVGPQDVVITYGEEFSVRAEGPSGELRDLDVSTDNGTLTIKPRGSFDFDWESDSQATFYITLPRLESVVLTGSGDMTVDRVEGDEFTALITGSGEMQIAGIKVDRAELAVVGSGTLTAWGTARAAEVSIGGSGEVDADGLSSEDADINIGGSGDVEMNVTGAADIAIMGSGDVAITGTDTCSVSRMGSGDVTCNGQQVGED